MPKFEVSEAPKQPNEAPDVYITGDGKLRIRDPEKNHWWAAWLPSGRLTGSKEYETHEDAWNPETCTALSGTGRTLTITFD